MSEQPEIDRASDIMRSRFLSGCQRVSAHLAWIEEHTNELQEDVRTFLTDAAKKIQAAQQRLAAQLDRLPTPQWERFKAMLTLLRAQQDVLDSVDALMQRARVSTVSRKIPGPVTGTENRDVVSASGDTVRRMRTRSLIWGATSARLIVITLIGAGFIFAYVTIPRDKRPVAMNHAPVATDAAGTGVASPSESPQHPRVKVDSGAAVPEATVTQAADDTRSISATPTPPPSTIPRANTGFVPVVFTDVDRVKVLRAFSELQLRFPKLFGQRRAEAQPVDLGPKGLWHRLVILPPGSRQSATEFCGQLLAAGYDRCWVKDY